MTLLDRPDDGTIPTPRWSGDLSDWSGVDVSGWGRAVIRVPHVLAATGLFTDAALTALIDAIPKSQASLVEMGAHEGVRRWRTGSWDGVSGAALLDHLKTHPLWLNLRAVDTAAPAHGALFETLLMELADAVPGLAPRPGKMGLLVSGPGTQVDYHADLPGQALMQVRGRKTVRLYPAEPPFLTPEGLQDIAYDGNEKLTYDPAFDAAAETVELGPGEALHWPHNAPHRVENGPMLNVSVTLEYLTDEIARLNRANLANAVARRRLGLAATARPTSGPGYWSRRALQVGAARLGLLGPASSDAVGFALVPGGGEGDGLVVRDA